MTKEEFYQKKELLFKQFQNLTKEQKQTCFPFIYGWVGTQLYVTSNMSMEDFVLGLELMISNAKTNLSEYKDEYISTDSDKKDFFKKSIMDAFNAGYTEGHKNKDIPITYDSISEYDNAKEYYDEKFCK